MDLRFTAVFRQVPEGYIGFVEELPGANTQGATLEEARANLHEAVAMILDANRELAQQTTGTGPVIREPLKDQCVKRRALIHHLEQRGCRLLREGGNHSIFVSPAVERSAFHVTPRSTTTSPRRSAKTSAFHHRSDVAASAS
jgi:predicted RNase H-like HicB family nuclease